MRARRSCASKESDRIEAVVEELRRIGGHIRATRDGFRVQRRTRSAARRGRRVAWRPSHRDARRGRGRLLAGGRRAPRRRGRRRELSGLLRGSRPGRAGLGSLPSRGMIVAIDGPAGLGKEHRRVAARPAPRLSLPRHRGDVPRAHVARARDGCRARRRRRARGARARAPGLVRRGRARRDRRRGRDRAIRDAEIDRLVPAVARHPEVREVMRERQRALAELGRLRHRRARHRERGRAGRRGEGVSRRRRGRARATARGRASWRRRGDARRPTSGAATSATP